jgi:hypothetical protein
LIKNNAKQIFILEEGFGKESVTGQNAVEWFIAPAIGAAPASPWQALAMP